MKLKMDLLVAMVFGFLMITGCTSVTQQDSNKLKVVASFYPMYDFARNVGGDRIDVKSLIPMGVEPHEYEPTPQDIKDLSTAKVLILNGVIESSWAPKLLEGVDNKNLVVVDTSKGIQLVGSMDADMPGNDPHIWLDPVLAKKQVAAIRDAFIQADPAGKDYYEKNAELFMQKLDSLDAEFHSTFATCQKKDILITHATLAYFCKEYGCNQVPVEGVNAEGDPSPAVLAEIIKQAEEKNITTVFVENLMNPKSAETIAGDIHGKVAIFNSVHGLTTEEQQRGENYISQMQENVGIIRTSLDCK
ncbi:MAG: zinc ABC transporter substrate-binding protein [archaeon]